MTLSIIASIIYIVFVIYGSMMSISILLSWFPGSYEIKLLRIIKNIGDLYLDDFRGRMIVGFFDVGTIVGLIIYGAIGTMFSIWI